MNDQEIPMTTMEPVPPTPTTPVTPVAPVVAPRSRQGGRWLNVLLALAFAVALGGVAFAVGRSTAPAAVATVQGNGGAGFVPGGSFAPGGNGQGRGPVGAGGALTVTGTVESIANGKLTVKLASGDTMTFTLDGSTTYRSATAATATDVAVGDKVDVGVTGGRATFGGGGATSSAAPDLTARDVTVVR
jgi:hypothetical protein